MNEKKIMQIITNDGDYVIVEKIERGWSASVVTEKYINIVAWALVENEHGSRWIEPLILGPRGLVLLTDMTEWSIRAL